MTQIAKHQLTSNRKGEIQLSLSAPEMTAMHRMGIAGLWMTLQQLEDTYPNSRQRTGNLTWSLSPQSIHVRWEGADYKAIDWLFKQAFQVDGQGLILLLGLNTKSLNSQAKLLTHYCLLNTFLQHNKFYQKGNKHTKKVTLGDRSLLLRYSKVINYAHQSFATHLCDENGNLTTEHIPIAGWLYPGAVVRHARFGEKTKFEESPERAFALLFAPVACSFYLLLPSLERKTIQFALVTPHITNLDSYAQACWKRNDSGFESLCVLSEEEAGLKSLADLALFQPLEKNEIRHCSVTTFGTVDWAKQQKTRLGVTRVETTNKILEEYQLSYNCFEASKKSYRQVQTFQRSYAHAIVVSNISRGRAWWHGFFEEMKNLDAFQAIFREGKELFKMIENTHFEEQSYIFFIKACHEAFKKSYAKIYGRASDTQYVDIPQKNLRVRSQLNRCKNAESFRLFLNDFFAKSAPNSVLEEHWQELLPVLTGMTDWKFTRDLFLLAMASYPSIEGAKRRAEQESNDSNSE